MSFAKYFLPQTDRHSVVGLSFLALLISLFIWPCQQLRAEGTRQVAPSADDQVLLLTGRDNFSNFAEFNGPADSRLHISVSDDPDEVIFIGLSGEYDDNGLLITRRTYSRYKFRIKNEAGEVVHGPFIIDYTTANINSWENAAFGAYSTSYEAFNPATGQVDPVFRFRPGQAGHYYIEFDDEGSDGDEKVLIGLWDFTVAKGAKAIPGRVWSRNWAFRTPPDLKKITEAECRWNREFNGELYSYTTDGFVSKINFEDSGFQGLAFTVAFNSTGPGTSGDLEEDRLSRPDTNLTRNSAEHQIFLNNPDEALFPSGDRGSAFVNPNFRLKEDSFCLDVLATRPGQVEVILDFNRNGSFDPELDVSLLYCFEKDDFSNLPTGIDPCDTTSTSTARAEICWDGIKGDGNSVTCGDTVNLIVAYTQGVQHWAVYDGEFMKNGFCVEVIRPICPDDSEILTDELYWDDRLIDTDAGSGQPKVNLDGCECGVDGCRTWDNFNTNQACDDDIDDSITSGYGDKNTLNTWWFANVTRQVTANIPILSCEITGRDTICEGEETEFFAEGGTNEQKPKFVWTGPDGEEISRDASTGPIDQPGIYTVTITDKRDCQVICRRELVVNPLPELTLASKQNVSCRDADDGVINLSASGGSGDYLYSLNGSAFLPDSTFTGLSPGVYTAVLQDIAGCSDTLSVSIGIDQLPVLNYPDTLLICAGETVQPSVTADTTLNYQWTPVEGLDDPTAAAPVFSPEMTTTYFVDVSKKRNEQCSVQDTLVIVVKPAPELTISGEMVVCDQQTTLTASTDIPAEIRWLDSTGTILGQGPELSLTLEGDRVIIAEAIADNGCRATEQVLLTDASIDVKIPDLITACLGDDLTINVMNNKPKDDLTFEWTPVDDFEPGTADDQNPVLTQEVGERTVYVKITNEYGCMLRDSVDVIVIDSDYTLDFSYEVECNGATVQFTNLSTGATGFEWDFGDPDNPGARSTEENPSYTYTEAGTYLVTLSLRYDFPCSDTTSITKEVIVADPRVIADFDFDFECAPGSATINFTDASSSATEGIVTWDWTFSNGESSSEQNPQVTITESTTLVVDLTITTENDCEASVQDTLNFILPELKLRDTILCPGESVILNPGGDPALEYEWVPAAGLSDPAAASPLAMPEQTTTYTVTVRGIGSDTCTLTGQVTVQVEAPLNLTVSDDQTTCGEDVTLTASADGEAAFVWRNQQGTILGQDASIVVNPDREATYFVTATSPAGCPETDSVTVTDQGIEVIVFTEDVTGCGPQEVAVEVANQRPEDILLYEWIPDSLVSDPELPNPIIRVEEGSVSYRLRIENQFGCVDTIDAFTITALPEPQPNLPDTVIVCSDIATGKELAPGADPRYQYEWSPATGLDRTDVPNPKFSGSESITYTVLVTDIIGEDTCTVIKTVDVIVQPPINLITTPDTTLCTPAELTLTAESAIENVTFTWFDEFSLEDTIGTGPEITVFPPVGVTTYNVLAQDEAGCTQQGIITVTVSGLNEEALPDPEVGVCSDVPTPINPDGNPDYNYQWAPLTGLDTTESWNPIVTTGTNRTYSVTVTDPATGCFLEGEVLVRVISINLMVSADTILCETVPVTLNAQTDTENAAIQWFDNPDFSGTPLAEGSSYTFTPASPGMSTFYVKAEVGPGCMETDSVKVTVVDFDTGIDSPITVCADQDTTLAFNPDFEYNWSDTTGVDLSDPSNPVVNLGESRTYTITVTDPESGCEKTMELVVEVIPVLTLTVTPPDTTLCEPTSVTLTATANLDVDILWFDNADLEGVPLFTGNEFTVIPGPGVTTYYLLAEGEGPCQEPVIRTATVTVLDLPGNSNLPDTTLVACEGTAFTLFLNPEYNYTWSPTTGLDLSDPSRPVITATEDITYNVTIEDPATGCMVMDTLALDVIPLPRLVVSGDTTLCEPADVRLIAKVEGDAPLEWSLDPNFQGPPLSTMDTIVVRPEETTTYYVRALIDTVLCPVTGSATVELAAPPVPEGFPDSTLVACQGDSIQLELAEGLIYQWTPEDGLDLSDPANPVIIADTDRTYDVLITDPETGCDTTVQVRTEVRPRDTLQIETMDVTLCEPQETTLTATTTLPATFKWYDNPALEGTPLMGSSITVTPSQGTTSYFVVAMSEDSCIDGDTAEVAVTVQDLPGTSGLPGEPIPACQGDTVMLMLNPAYTYEWSPSIGLDLTDPANPKIKALNSITYSVTITDEATGCEATAEVELEVGPDVELMVSPADTTLCEPEEITFVADAGAPARISWYANAGLTVPILEDNDTLRFNPPVGTTTIYVLAEGTGLCTKNDTAVVRVFVLDPFEGVTFPEGPIQACPGETDTLTLPEGFEYSWIPQEGIDTSDPLAPVFTITEARTYTLMITDTETGCVKELVYEALPFPLPEPVINRDINTRLCEAGAVLVEASTAIAATIEWFDTPAFNPPALAQGNIVPVDILSDSTWIYAVATSADGCTGVDSILFTLVDLIDESGIDTLLRLCPDESRRLELNPAFTYQWAPDDANIDLTDPARPVFSGEGIYMVTITDEAAGCLDTTTVNVEVNPEIGLIASEDRTVCSAEEIELNATTEVPATIEWTSSDPGFGMQSGPMVTAVPPAGTTFYYAKATDTTALVCMATDTVRIDFFPVDASLSDVISCEPADELELTVVNNDENQELMYLWFPPEAVLSDPMAGPRAVVDPNVATEYSVDLVNQFGCDTTLTASAEVIILGDSLSITPDTTIFEGEEVPLEVTGCADCMYDWSPKDGTLNATDIPNPVATPSETTTYTVIVEKEGCLDTLDVVIGLEDFICGFPNVYLPNAFTPNGDGVNDVLLVRGRNITRVFLIIFNRWGQKVFESSDQSVGWDGTFEGELLPPDVYGYYLEVQCGDGETYTVKGNITLIR